MLQELPPKARSAAAGSLALWSAGVHFVLTLGWIAYVVYLPGLMGLAGIDKHWLVWLLLIDQGVFALSDWLAATWSDRLAEGWRRLAPPLVAFALLSSAAMLALPWAASAGPWALGLCTLAWSAGSSALRAPVFALLGKAAAPAKSASLLGAALTGGALASALAPLVTGVLKSADPRWALGVGAAALAGAALFLLRLRAPGPIGAASPAASPAASATVSAASSTASSTAASPAASPGVRLALIGAWVALFAMGAQLAAGAIGERLLRASAADPAHGPPAFWLGFALVALAVGRHERLGKVLTGGWSALVPGDDGIVRDAFARNPVRVLGRHAPVLAAAGAVALLALPFAPGPWGVGAALAVVGALWAALLNGLFVRARDALPAGRTASPAGLLFAALAVGAMLRLGLVAGGLGAWEALAWVPAIAWLVAGIGLRVSGAPAERAGRA